MTCEECNRARENPEWFRFCPTCLWCGARLIQKIGALKGVRDQVAAWLGVDDRHKHIVRYAYEQERGPWAVRIEWRPMEV